MKNGKTVLFCVLIIGLLMALSVAAQSVVYRGKVQWANGNPAMGLEVKIMQASREVAKTFTNEKGLYAFFDLTAPPKNFMVVVSDHSGVVGQLQVNDVGDGKLTDIIVK